MSLYNARLRSLPDKLEEQAKALELKLEKEEEKENQKVVKQIISKKSKKDEK